MVELSRSFLNRRLERTPPAATLSGVPGLPRIPDDSGALAQASATFAQGLAALGKAAGQIAERDLQLKRADEVAKAGQALGQFGMGMATVQQGLVESNMPALDRPQALRTGGEELIQTLVQTVPPRAQERFKAEATQALARMVLSEQSSAATQFVHEQKAALPPLLDLLGRQLVGADDRQRPAILQSMTATATSFAEAGIVPAPLAQALVREAVDRNDTLRTQQAIVAQPAAMQQHLTDLAAGKPGTPGLPVPPAKDLADLKRAADGQVGQDLARLDRDERDADKKLRQIQDANMLKLQDRLAQPDLTTQEVQRLRQEATTLAEQRLLSPTDHGMVMRDTRTLTKALQEGPAQTDPAVKRSILITLYGGELGGQNLDLVKDHLMQWIDEGKVNLKDGQEWMQEITRQRQANYYTKIPAYDEGRDFLQMTVNYLSKISVVPGADKKAIEEMQSRTAYALQTYSERVRSVWEREGIRGVEAQAAAIAREVQTYFSLTPPQVLAHFPPPPALAQAEGTTVAERYTDAARRLQAMDLPDSERANQARLLQERRVIEEQVERNNPPPPAKPLTTPPIPNAPRTETTGQWRSERTGEKPPFPVGDPRRETWEREGSVQGPPQPGRFWGSTPPR